MMKHIIYLFFLSSFLLNGYYSRAAVPDWSVTPENYQNSMTVICALNMDYAESSNGSDLVATFIDGECRGVGNPIYIAAVDRWFVYLFVYSNESVGDVEFKMYNYDSDTVYDVETTQPFSVNSQIGSSIAPYIVSSPTLSNEAEMLTFTIPGQEGVTIYSGTDITVAMPFGTDLTALIPDYTSSPNARVQVSTLTQTSGLTANDYTNSLEFTVRSADETVEKAYTVSVTIANYVPTDIIPSVLSFNETILANSPVLILSSEDSDNDNHIYSLVSGSGDTDNATFSVEGNNLKIVSTPDYETKTEYSIRLKTEDADGGSFEKEFILSVIDENDEQPIASDLIVNFDETIVIADLAVAVEATDADFSPAFNTLNYQIVNGNTPYVFDINSTSGIITIATPADFIINNGYNLEVAVTDGLFTDTANITINYLGITIPTISFNETLLANDTIFNFSSANSGNGSFIYSLVAGEGDTDNESFVINDNNLQILLEPDYETKTFYNIRLKIIHSDGGSFEKAFTLSVIDENDEQPIASDLIVNFDETILIADLAVAVQATDADFSPAFNTLNYQIVNGNTPYLFDIDSVSGIITLSAAPDYEIKAAYNLEVTVNDGLFTNIANITINFIDVNDEAPIFADTTFTVNEFATLGTIIGQLTATDADADSQINFTIESGDDFGTFSVTPNGEVSLTDYLDFGMQPQYELTITVDDGVNTAIGQLTIILEDVNESLFDAVNIFSPNGDGINDLWEVENANYYRDCEFMIFNNIGEIILQQTGYNNDWDGTYKGKPLAVGTYYYVLICNNCTDCKHAGSISIVR